MPPFNVGELLVEYVGRECLESHLWGHGTEGHMRDESRGEKVI